MSKQWSNEDLATLRSMAGSSSLKEMSETLGRDTRAVRWKAKKLGLTFVDARRYNTGVARTMWTDEKLESLAEMAPELSHKELAERLDVTEEQIRHALEHYGIQGRGRGHKRSAEERAQISATLQAKYAEKFPPEGPWECLSCHETLPVSEFPNANWKRCYICLNEGRVQKLYNISIEQYRKMLKDQDGVCAICKKPEEQAHGVTGRTYALSVDHDHKCCPGKTSCGKCVRGLLCRHCNHAVGKLEVQGVDLQVLAKYLLRVVASQND